MGTLTSIANKKSAAGGGSINTGTLGNSLEFGTPIHLIKLAKGTVLPKATVFNKAYIDGQTKLGLFSPIIGADSFNDASTDDKISTNTRGIDRLSLKGLPKYEFIFEQGNEFYKQLAKMTSFKSADFILGDENGNWKLAVKSNGDFAGFTAGQILAKLTKAKVQGGEPESKLLSVQFLDRLQLDSNYAIITQDNLDFIPEELNTVNSVKMAITTIPTAAGTTVDFTALLASDNNTPVLGLLAPNVKITVDGVVKTATIADLTGGAYRATITAMAAGQVVTVELVSASAAYDIVLISTVLYRSDVASVTVLA